LKSLQGTFARSYMSASRKTISASKDKFTIHPHVTRK